jgi:hypothetical protein
MRQRSWFSQRISSNLGFTNRTPAQSRTLGEVAMSRTTYGVRGSKKAERLIAAIFGRGGVGYWPCAAAKRS